jgi:hypothetical protein
MCNLEVLMKLDRISEHKCGYFLKLLTREFFLKLSQVSLQCLLINQRKIVKHHWFLFTSCDLYICRRNCLLLNRMIKGDLGWLLERHSDSCCLGSCYQWLLLLLILKVEVNCWGMLRLLGLKCEGTLKG